MIDVHFKPNPPSNVAEAAHMDTAAIYKQKAEHFCVSYTPVAHACTIGSLSSRSHNVLVMNPYPLHIQQRGSACTDWEQGSEWASLIPS